MSELEFSLAAIGPLYNDVTIGKRLKLFTGDLLIDLIDNGILGLSICELIKNKSFVRSIFAIFFSEIKAKIVCVSLSTRDSKGSS